MKTENSGNVPAALVYNGEIISAKSEMLSLTDMWKAQGSDPARQPSNWLASADAKHFTETLDILEPGNSGVQTKRGGRGIGGSTFAHWQIALAYAKYLSPEFHMWCNTVVRERMEGRHVPEISGSVDLSRETLNSVGGIVKRGNGAQTRDLQSFIESAVQIAVTGLLPTAVAAAVASGRFTYGEGVTAGEVIDMSGVTGAPGLRGCVGMVTRRLFASECYLMRGRLGKSTAYLFDAGKCRKWLDEGGGKRAIQNYVERWDAKKKGQGSLKLVPSKSVAA